MRPNIVFITCHDLGRHLGCYGQRTVASPALDNIAARGLLFERSFCTAPQCSPSRAALHTGRHAHANGMHGLAHEPFNWRLHDGERHLAHYLREQGYRTALFGIQHLTDAAGAPGLGYDELYERAPAAALGRAASDWLRARDGAAQPFYLEVGFFEPHRRWDFGDVKPDDHLGADIPAYLPQTPEARNETAELQGAIAALDAAVAQIVAALEARGLLQDTWLIFVTDHGLAMPRAKCTLYDPGIETALLMHWPGGGLRGGRRIPQLVTHVDVVPTVLEALGIKAPQRLHGRSFWPLLMDADYEARDAVFAGKTFHTAWEPMRGLRTEQYKLVLKPLSGRRGQRAGRHSAQPRLPADDRPDQRASPARRTLRPAGRPAGAGQPGGSGAAQGPRRRPAGAPLPLDGAHGRPAAAGAHRLARPGGGNRKAAQRDLRPTRALAAAGHAG